MKFDNFWNKIQKQRNDVRLETISRKQGFILSYDQKFDEAIIVPDSTQIPRHIPRKDFEKVWLQFKEIKGDAFRPAFYQRTSLNASYILPIMKKHLGGSNVN